MNCLQFLIPVLLLPKSTASNHGLLTALYLFGFFLDRKPCTLCSIVFLVAVFLLKPDLFYSVSASVSASS